jgi:hypothetical protein
MSNATVTMMKVNAAREVVSSGIGLGVEDNRWLLEALRNLRVGIVTRSSSANAAEIGSAKTAALKPVWVEIVE